MTILRPPTFDRLRDRPAHDHIVPFDGHGSYRAGAAGTRHALGTGAQGRLIFEDDDGQGGQRRGRSASWPP